MSTGLFTVPEALSAAYGFFFGQDAPRGLFAFRVLFGATLFFESIHLWWRGWVWYSDDGIYPSTERSPEFLHARRHNILLRFAKTRGGVRAVTIAYSIACICLALGFGTRIAALLVFLFSAARRSRNFWVASSSDSVATLTSLVLVFGNAGSAYSLDQLYGVPHLISGAGDHAIWATQCLRLLLSTIYFRTAEAKMRNPRWADGTVVYHLLAFSGGKRQVPMIPFMKYRWASSMATWGTIFVQLGGSFALWFEETRWFAMAALLGLHISLELFMNIKHFQYLMMALVLLFVP